MLCALYSLDGGAAIRVGNLSRSYADAYNTVNTYNAVANGTLISNGDDAANALPVRVANKDLALKIARGDSDAGTTVANLESCALVYPDGEFAWDRPTVGIHAGGDMTCVATVEMRTVGTGVGGTDVVLARAYVAAGDGVKCNISAFPESAYTLEAGNIEFPADSEPTMDDVIQVMNDEQKKNAGLKIAAGTVIGGLMGNFAGKNEIGKDGALGTGKGKMQGAAIGALSGGALMAANTFGGKVAGDTILSTGVNAAAGSAIGNMVSSNNQVMRIEECSLPTGKRTKCLWGVLQISRPIDVSKNPAYYNISMDSAVQCDEQNENCNPVYLTGIVIDGYRDIDEAIEEKFTKVLSGEVTQYTLDDREMTPGYSGNDGGIWVKITSAGTPDQQIMAMVSDVPEKAFGMTRQDWVKWRREHSSDAKIWGRTNSGDAYELAQKYALSEFNPLVEHATDGALIDYGNRARTKDTLIGAGAGAGLGALSGYQGAQSDIQDRWVTEVRQYQDSLQKIYCATGRRFLGHYNDELLIPNVAQ